MVPHWNEDEPCVYVFAEGLIGTFCAVPIGKPFWASCMLIEELPAEPVEEA